MEGVNVKWRGSTSSGGGQGEVEWVIMERGSSQREEPLDLS